MRNLIAANILIGLLISSIFYVNSLQEFNLFVVGLIFFFGAIIFSIDIVLLKKNSINEKIWKWLENSIFSIKFLLLFLLLIIGILGFAERMNFTLTYGSRFLSTVYNKDIADIGIFYFKILGIFMIGFGYMILWIIGYMEMKCVLLKNILYFIAACGDNEIFALINNSVSQKNSVIIFNEMNVFEKTIIKILYKNEIWFKKMILKNKLEDNLSKNQENIKKINKI